MSVSKESRHPPAERSFEEIEAKLRACEQENANLRRTLTSHDRDMLRLVQWLQSLKHDIHDIYHSNTWRIGAAVVRAILFLLRKPIGPTARDHVERVEYSFALWKKQFFNHYTQDNTRFLPYLPWHPTEEYRQWLARYDSLSPAQQAQWQIDWRNWPTMPRFSIIIPLPAAPEPVWLQETFASLSAQVYPAWEAWVLAEEGSDISKLLQADETRLHILRSTTPGNRAERLNQALQQAGGDFVLLLDAHDRLSPQALFRAAQHLHAHPKTELLYSDEDKLDTAGGRYDPYFKSDWNLDLFYSQNFLAPSGVFRRNTLIRLGGFRADAPGEEVYDLALRLLEDGLKPKQIHHIPRGLYHRRACLAELDNATLAQKSLGAAAALRGHFQRQGHAVTVEAAPGGHTRVRYALPAALPLVSIIIPTRDRVSLLQTTLRGVLTETDYPALEVIIVDNASKEPETLAYLEALVLEDPRVRVIKDRQAFNFSRLNNLGAAQACGEILALLNNYLQVINPDWLLEMVSQALRPDIGAVGAKLYYTDNSVQHAGVVVGLGGMAGHGLKCVPRAAPAYHWKPFLVQNYSAVTAACLVMRRAVFEQAGGLEERHLKVAFNDVDLCLRLQEQGYRIVWTPYAEFYHIESASRGADNTLRKYWRLQHELTYMRKRWPQRLAYDPYYNPNLSTAYEDYGLAYPPRLPPLIG